VLVRFTRESMLKVMDQNFIKTARAKGLNRGQLIIHHALRNALLPVIKQIGLQFSTLITLAMITEVIFSWPGIGRWLIDSIYQRDYP
ncbi:ABC transporter permease, partial [Pseudoalteromonas sp. GW168-MNA-CIBAN-0100]